MAAGLCTVIRSANEVMVLAAKAARGAGVPPEQASRFGAAAVLHLGGGGALDALDAALQAGPDGPIMSLPLVITRIAEGHKGGIAQGLLAPDPSGLANSYVAALPCEASLQRDGTVRIDFNRPAVRPVVSRIDLPDETYGAWSVLAARLLVPESEVSRSCGAGSATSDND